MAAPVTVFTYDLNGTQKDFPIPFEYLARKFVQVTLLGTDRKPLILNTDYRFSTNTTITTTIAWGAAQGYERIELKRYTSATDRLVDFSDGSILRAYDLNTAQIQSLHIAEEGRDIATDTIGVDNNGNLDARGRKIVNLADAVLPGDAVTLRQEQAWAQSALNSSIASEVSRQASLAQANISTTQAGLSQTSRLASEAARDLAKDWSSKAEDVVVTGGLYSSYHYSKKSAASAATATTQAGLATTNGAAQVALAAAQVALATTQANLATTNGQAQVALATTQAGIATTQAGLATTNGAAQVALATTQAGIATTKATEAAASAAVVGGVVAVNRTFRNLIINGNFRFWQRRTTLTLTNAFDFCADRWGTLVNEGTITANQQVHTVGQTDVPGNPSFYQRTAMSGMTLGANQGCRLFQRIEDVQTAQAQMVTLTYWARASVNGAKLGTEFAQSFGPNAASPTQALGNTITLTTTWTKYTRQVTIPSITGKTITGQHCLELSFWFSAGSTAAARLGTSAWAGSGYIDISQVQLEIGEATPFEILPNQVQLELCRRYYEQIGGTISPTQGRYLWNKWATFKYRSPAPLGFISGSSPGTSADIINAEGFRWGFAATADADWTLGAEAEIQ